MEHILECAWPLSIIVISLLFFTKIKPNNLSVTKKALLYTGFIILATSVFIFFRFVFPVADPYKTAIVIFISSVSFAFLLRERIEVMITAFILVFAASYILLSIVVIPTFLLTSPFLSPDASDDGFRYTINGILCIIAAVLLRKIKVDFSPIFKKHASGVFLSISSIVIIFIALGGAEISDESTLLVIAGCIMLSYGIYSWFRRETTISKDEDAKEVADIRQKAILEQKEKDIAVLKNLQAVLASADHKNAKTLDGMQRTVEKLIMRSEQTEVLDDCKLFLDELDLSREKANRDFTKKVYDGKTIPKTGILIVDSQFETLFEKAMLKSVEFDIDINGDVSAFGKAVPQVDLSNMIGDLVENAFTAISYLDTSQPCHKIHVSIGSTGAGHELTVSDSGIPFDIDTLFKLGVERITSHPDAGGSGYGYETIFELLKEYEASLIITEYKPVPYAYSKDITIRFDGKSEYIIKSFRADAIKKQNSNPNLAVVRLKDKN